MVVLLLANGFEELEALTVVDVLRRRNIDIRTVSITHDKLVTGTHGIQVKADLTADEVPTKDINMLVLPGGMPGVKNLDCSIVTHNFIAATLKNGGRLAAICAAPSIFGRHGMLTNIKVTCFPGFEEDLLNAVVVNERVVTDEIFTTAKDFTCSMEFANELARIYEEVYGDNIIEEQTEEVLELNFDSAVDEDPTAEENNSTYWEMPDYSSYKLPSTDLLKLAPATAVDPEELTENSNILIDTLASFNVSATITNVDVGPRVSRYELVPARGVKVQHITGLFSDITLNLAKEGVRMEAPIPGKSAVGFEIPNKTPQTISLRELLELDEFANSNSKTMVAIGKDVAGNPIFGDIAKYPHALICGATGMGKSVLINTILASILYKARPDEVKFILIDPKKVEFTLYNDMPHLLTPVITNTKDAVGALAWTIQEMERRYELIEKLNIRNIEAYNEKVKADPTVGNPIPKIVIVIDELADLMMQAKDPIENFIMRIAQKARAAGIHLLVSTQRPSVQVLTGAIKANIPTRMTCKVTSQVDSRTILDMGGAEKLLSRGDMLYWPVDKTSPIRVQCVFVSDSEIEQIVSNIKENNGDAVYDSRILEEIDSAASKYFSKPTEKLDEDDSDNENAFYFDQQFIEAVELAIYSKKVSTSLLQRKLSIGYGKAAKYIDAMEQIGVVSEPRGQKPRDILITKEEWDEKLRRLLIIEE